MYKYNIIVAMQIITNIYDDNYETFTQISVIIPCVGFVLDSVTIDTGTTGHRNISTT